MQAALALSTAGSTMTFSYLGAVRLLEGMAPYAVGLEVSFSPKPGSPYSCAMSTLGDDLRLTLLEEYLERVFQAQGLGFSTEPPCGQKE